MFLSTCIIFTYLTVIINYSKLKNQDLGRRLNLTQKGNVNNNVGVGNRYVRDLIRLISGNAS